MNLIKKKVLSIVAIVLINLLTISICGCIAVGTRLTINGVQGYIDAIQHTGPEIIMEVYPSGSFKLSSAYAVTYRDNTLEVLYCWLDKGSNWRAWVWVERHEDRDTYWGATSLPTGVGEFALVGDESKEKPITNITCGGFFGTSTIIWTNRGTKAPSDQLFYQIAGRKFVPGSPPNSGPHPAPPAAIPEKGLMAFNQNLTMLMQKSPKFSKITGNTVFFEGGSLTLFGENFQQLKQYLQKGKLEKLLSAWGNLK